MMTSVFIVGAGPTGLALACSLRRLGIDCRVIDKADGPATTSRAIGTHSRTLEIFSMMGCSEAILARGHRATGMTMFAKGETVLDLEFGTPGHQSAFQGAPYPYVLIMPQAETEGVLREHLRSLGGEVEWGTSLASFADGKGGVRAEIEGPNGKETVAARYMVSCEGAHSSVRHALGIPFEGEKYAAEFLLMDVDVAWDVPREKTAVWFGKDAVFAAMPLPGTSLWRLFADVRPGPDGKVPPATRELFQELLVERTGLLGVSIGEPLWASNFQIHKRMVDRYRSGNVFLAGDAAHVHSPFGGQGMNTGIGDAWNLAWKLAWVLGGRTPESLLDTYGEERLPIAREVLRSTNRSTRLFYGESPLLRAFRRWVLLPLFHLRGMQSRLVWSVSQLGVNYRDRSLSEGKLGSLRGGDRLPDGVIGPSGERAHARLDGRRLTLFGLGLSARERKELLWNRDVALVEIGAAEAPDSLVRSARLPDKGVIVVRPDGYIGIATVEPSRAIAWMDRLSGTRAGRARVLSAPEVRAA